MNDFKSNSVLPVDCLPDSIKSLMSVLSMDTVYKLIDNYGGTRLIVPKVADCDHELAYLMGMDDLVKFCHLLGGSVFECPRCMKALRAVQDNRILQEKRAGATLSQLARRYRITERCVTYSLRRAEKAEYQQRVQTAQLDWIAFV